MNARDDDLRLIQLSGEIDVSSARRIRAQLIESVGDTTRQPVVDLSNVTFLDSTGLGAIMHARDQLGRQGRELVLVVPDEGPVARLLEASGLVGAFKTVESAEDVAGK